MDHFSRAIERATDTRRVLNRILVPAFSLLVSFGSQAQDEPVGPCDKPFDKKILKLLAEAAKEKNPTERHRILKSTQEIDPSCTECLFQLGMSAFGRANAGAGSFDAAIKYLEEVKAQCPDYHSDLYFALGMMYYGKDEFPGSAQALQKFLKFPTDDATKFGADIDAKIADAEKLMPELAFYAEFYKDQRPFTPSVMRGVSTGADEYLPMFSPDNELLFFTRVTKKQAKGDFVTIDIEELTESRRTDIKLDFDKGAPLPKPFNMGDNYGGVTVSMNNKEVFVTICRPVSKDYKNCDIFRSHFDTNVDFETGKQTFEWTEPTNLGPNINTEDGWESQPTLSADGKTLFFAAARPGLKGIDIMQSTRDDKGEWGVAKPMPAPINTAGDEKAPFLHSDSHTLYFAARPPKDDNGKEDLSRGHRGIGGYDVFYSHLDDNGVWTAPKNIGHPINTAQDDHGLIVSADGRMAYFGSSRFKGAGGLDIYGFELPKEARPEDILIVKGEVKNDEGQPVLDAEVTITYMDTRKTEVIKVDGTNGKYVTVVKLKPGADVIMTVKKSDHVFDSRSFTAEDTTRGGVAAVEMKLSKIEVGRSYKMTDIRYATNSADITKSSEYILDELISFLKDNQLVQIEVQGHTDNVGSLEDNMALSHDRSFTVRSYLEAHGIKGSRLTSKGYGPTQPVASNETSIGRAQNRRTTFVIKAK
ncbi:MAG: OmpA family protein [Flavobacteriales bacterium]|nr:OmpA family protein [Flavobacteriales bacterium]